MDAILDRLKATTSNFTAAQLATIAGAFVVVVAIVAGSAWWLNTPNYALLFAEMDAESAAQVVTRLKSMKVPLSDRSGWWRHPRAEQPG